MKLQLYYALLVLFILSNSKLVGQEINGVIYYQNSNGETASGIEVSAFGCNTTYSLSNGMFTLICPQKKVGQKAKLIFGRTDSEGKSIEIVNSRQLEWLRIPDPSQNNPIDIIICYAGERDRVALAFHGILVKSTSKEFERKLSDIELQLKQNNISAGERKALIEQIDELKQERDIALEKLEEQALFIASINKDKASELVKSALEKINNQQDIEQALSILNAAQLEEAYQTAFDNKLKAENEINQVIEAYELRLSLLLPKCKYLDVIHCNERILEIYIANEFSKDEIAKIQNRLAEAYYDNGEYRKALKLQQEIIRTREEMPDSTMLDLADAYSRVATTYMELGNYDLATSNMLKAVTMAERDDQFNKYYKGSFYGNLGLIYEKQGDYEDALKYQKLAMSLLTAEVDSMDVELAACYNNTSIAYQKLGKLEQSLFYIDKSINIYEKGLDPNHHDLAIAYGNKGTILNRMKRYNEALENHQKCLAILEKTLNKDHLYLATAYHITSLTFSNLKDYETALAYATKTLKILERTVDVDHPYALINYNTLRSIYFDLGDAEQAMDWQKKVIDIMENKYGIGHIKLSLPYNMLGVLYQNLNKLPESIELFEMAREADSTFVNREYFNNIGMSYAKSKQFEKAHYAFTKYEKIFPNHGRTFRNWAVYYSLQNNTIDALANLEKAIELNYDYIDFIENDESLNAVRNTEKYKELLIKLKKENE